MYLCYICLKFKNSISNAFDFQFPRNVFLSVFTFPVPFRVNSVSFYYFRCGIFSPGYCAGWLVWNFNAYNRHYSLHYIPRKDFFHTNIKRSIKNNIHIHTYISDKCFWFIWSEINKIVYQPSSFTSRGTSELKFIYIYFVKIFPQIAYYIHFKNYISTRQVI